MKKFLYLLMVIIIGITAYIFYTNTNEGKNISKYFELTESGKLKYFEEKHKMEKKEKKEKYEKLMKRLYSKKKKIKKYKKLKLLKLPDDYIKEFKKSILKDEFIGKLLKIDNSKLTDEEKIAFLGDYNFFAVVPYGNYVTNTDDLKSTERKWIIKNNFENMVRLHKEYGDELKINIFVTNKIIQKNFDGDVEKLVDKIKEDYDVELPIYILSGTIFDILYISDPTNGQRYDTYLPILKYDDNYIKEVVKVLSNNYYKDNYNYKFEK